MSKWYSKVTDNLRASALALLVHVLLFALMGLSLTWNRTIKPSAMQPIQAVAIIEAEPIEKPPEPIPEPEPEPEPIPEPEPEPIPEPPKPKPEPVKSVFAYQCGDKQMETNSEEKAKEMQADCEEDERKKKELAEQKRKEEEKKKKEEQEKKKQEKLLADKKRKEEEKKKKELAEEKRKKEQKKEKELEQKKELAEKKRKEEARKKKELAEKKRQQEAARQKAAADARRKQEAALAAKIDGERIAGEAATALGLAVGRIAAAVDSNWIQPRTSTLGLEVIVRVNVRPTGEVMSARVVRGSGNALFDRSAEIAVLKASPLPIPSDPRYYPHIKEFDFRFKPNG